jgi:adenylate kinase family enzyme
MKVALVGAPGTDACTLGRLLASRLGVQHVSVRRLVDLEVRNRTALGLELGRGLEPGTGGAGGLLPFHLVTPLLDQLWTSGGPPSRFVLSGYPRSQEQWRHLRRHTDLTQILHIRSGAEFLRSSVAQRCVCPACAAGLYPDDLDLRDGSVLPAVLDCCGSTKEPARSARDESPAFEARLQAYEQTTRPWLESMRETGLVQEVRADARWPQIFPVVEHLVGLPPTAADAPESAPA